MTAADRPAPPVEPARSWLDKLANASARAAGLPEPAVEPSTDTADGPQRTFHTKPFEHYTSQTCPRSVHRDWWHDGPDLLLLPFAGEEP